MLLECMFGVLRHYLFVNSISESPQHSVCEQCQRKVSYPIPKVLIEEGLEDLVYVDTLPPPDAVNRYDS